MKNYSSILLVVLVFICQQIIFSQYRAFSHNEKPAVKDTLKVDLRLPSENILDRYKNNRTFDYSPAPESAESIWDKLINWINRNLFRMRSSQTFSTLLDYFLYGLMIAALIIVILSLFKSEIRGFFYGGNKEQKIKFAEYEEDIHKINFDELIAKAVNKKEYKIAVRYLFLKSLKLLSDKNIINLNINKTNHDYLSEIKKIKLAEQFSKAALGFELAWYGNFPIREEQFKYSEDVFNNLFDLTNQS